MFNYSVYFDKTIYFSLLGQTYNYLILCEIDLNGQFEKLKEYGHSFNSVKFTFAKDTILHIRVSFLRNILLSGFEAADIKYILK